MGDKYSQWWYETQIALHKRRQIQHKKKKKAVAAVITIIIAQIEKLSKRKYTKKRFWVNPLYALREQYGFYEAIFPTLSNLDVNFRNYMRMSLAQFETLLQKVGPSITKKVHIRYPIPAAARLAMTLRFFATGDCITSSTYSYLVSLTSASNIIHETSQVIWDVLRKTEMPSKLKQEDWLKIAADFESLWNFPNLVGSIDGKHVAIQCPEHTGSKFYNYKDFFSIILLAICDARYRFLYVDIGSCGRRSDGGVFKDSKMGEKFANNTMNLPAPKKIMVDGNPLPYFIVGDEAFPLTHFLLRPYPAITVDSNERRIFNYRLSRARRTIENTFGILVSRFRIFKKPMECSLEHATSIVQALVVLHNWLMSTDVNNEYIPVQIDEEALRKELEESILHNYHTHSNNNYSKRAESMREEFCTFFNNEGAVPWQYDINGLR